MNRVYYSALLTLSILCHPAIAQDLIWAATNEFTDASTDASHDFGVLGSDHDYDTGANLSDSITTVSAPHGNGMISTQTGAFCSQGGDGSTLYSVGGILSITNTTTSTPHAAYCVANASASSSSTLTLGSVTGATGARTVYLDLDIQATGVGNVMNWSNNSGMTFALYRNGNHLGDLAVAFDTVSSYVTWIPNQAGNSVRVTDSYSGTASAFSGHVDIEVDINIGDSLRVVTTAIHQAEFASDPDTNGVSGADFSLAVSTVPFGP